MGNDHSIALRCEQWGNVHETMDIVRPTVQEYDDGTVSRTDFRISHIQDTGIDLLNHAERRVATWLDRRNGYRRFRHSGFREGVPHRNERGRCHRQGS